MKLPLRQVFVSCHPGLANLSGWDMKRESWSQSLSHILSSSVFLPSDPGFRPFLICPLSSGSHECVSMSLDCLGNSRIPIPPNAIGLRWCLSTSFSGRSPGAAAATAAAAILGSTLWQQLYFFKKLEIHFSPLLKFVQRLRQYTGPFFHSCERHWCLWKEKAIPKWKCFRGMQPILSPLMFPSWCWVGTLISWHY